MARHREFDKDKALQQAMEIFWLKGYEATSVQDLLDAMGIHRGSMYDTFGDKHALYIAALNHYQELSQQRLLDLFARVESASEALSIFFYNQVQNKSVNHLRGCFINNAMVETASHDQQVAAITSYNTGFLVSEIARLLERGQMQGEIRQDKDAEALAQYLVSALQGMKITAKAGASPAMLKNIVEVTLLIIKTG